MTYLKIHHMPGPTPEAQAAQLQQFELLAAFHNAYNSTRSLESPECVRAKAAYDESVQSLEAMLGKSVPCHFVDCQLSQYFSDYYKAVNNFRPRGIDYTRQGVLDWCARQEALVTED